jgi:hypothetical protein
MRARGHSCSFLTRDSLIEPCYRVEHLVDRQQFGTHTYTGHYETDLDRFPGLRSYLRSRREIARFLSSLEFDIAVVCNDDAGYFVRILIDYCRRYGKEAILIQESVRPAPRSEAFSGSHKKQGRSTPVRSTLRFVARRAMSSALFRKGYGHSPCTMIAAAGDRFCRQLIAEGVAANKIRVTGQPRLDSLYPPDSADRVERPIRADPVLLFCTQPLPGTQPFMDDLFHDLISVCSSLGNVRLLFKLHPLDLPEKHWLRLIDRDEERFVADVTRKRPLRECFDMADGMITIASTTSLEAIAAGLPVGLVNYLPISWYLPFERSGAVLSIQRREDLEATVRALLFDHQVRSALKKNSSTVFLDELYLQDGRSAVRIGDFIEEKLGVVPSELEVYEHAASYG